MFPIKSILRSKWFIGLMGGLPFVYYIYAVLFDRLGSNPQEALIRGLGDWSIRFLIIVLSVTPLRYLLKQPFLASYRRMLGLLVYFYASLHLLAYVWFDMEWDLYFIGADIIKRPFILVGVVSWIILTLLAITSFNRAIKWLGARNWKRLHKLVYGVALLALLHFYWMRTGKHNYVEVIVYGILFFILFLWRFIKFSTK